MANKKRGIWFPLDLGVTLEGRLFFSCLPLPPQVFMRKALREGGQSRILMGTKRIWVYPACSSLHYFFKNEIEPGQ